jgi:hypothetical protein
MSRKNKKAVPTEPQPSSLPALARPKGASAEPPECPEIGLTAPEPTEDDVRLWGEHAGTYLTFWLLGEVCLTGKVFQVLCNPLDTSENLVFEREEREDGTLGVPKRIGRARDGFAELARIATAARRAIREDEKMREEQEEKQ